MKKYLLGILSLSMYGSIYSADAANPAIAMVKLKFTKNSGPSVNFTTTENECLFTITRTAIANVITYNLIEIHPSTKETSHPQTLLEALFEKIEKAYEQQQDVSEEVLRKALGLDEKTDGDKGDAKTS